MTLRIVRGPVPNSALVFEEHDTVVFGRSKDCHGRLPSDDSAVSRHHFLLEVSPPQARLSDLGSRHGTFVNGRKHGGRLPGERAEDAARRSYPQVDLHDGDEIRVGRSTIAVEIEDHAATIRPVDEPTMVAGAAPPSADSADTSMVPGYEVIRRIGVGGMGSVHLARRQVDGLWVALKVMLAKVVVNETARLRFARESSIVEQLAHPNVVAFYERGSVGSAFYFTMEFCPGGSLAQLLERSGGKLPFDDACSIALQALDALAYAHQREVATRLPDGRVTTTCGVVHRDIKPMNILLTGAERRVTAKLSDFGLAKCFQTAGLSGCTLTGDAAGALPYMPREQLLDFRNVRPTSDVWSMGATLYEMLTGTTPRDMPEGRDPLEVILGGRVVPIRDRDPTIPGPVADVVDRALAEQAERRFVDGREFRDALVSALSVEQQSQGGEMTTAPARVDASGVRDGEAAFAAFELASREAARAGETWTAGRVRQIRAALKAHPRASAIRHVRASGDGVLATFADVESAVDCARTLRLPFGDGDLPLRRVVHWGSARFSSTGEPTGVEVHRAMLLRDVGESDREVDVADVRRPLPRADRAILTRAALDRVSAAVRGECTVVGRFRLPGFESADELSMV